jgi:hypothetical protein
MSQIYFAVSNLAPGAASAPVTLSGGWYLLKVRRDPTAEGGINTDTTTIVRQLDADGVTQIERARMSNQHLISGVGSHLFQVDPSGSAVSILAGERGIAWAGIMDADGSEYF